MGALARAFPLHRSRRIHPSGFERTKEVDHIEGISSWVCRHLVVLASIATHAPTTRDPNRAIPTRHDLPNAPQPSGYIRTDCFASVLLSKTLSSDSSHLR